MWLIYIKYRYKYNIIILNFIIHFCIFAITNSYDVIYISVFLAYKLLERRKGAKLCKLNLLGAF